MPIYALDGDSPKLPEKGQFWVAPSAQIIGRVRIGKDVGVWFGTVIRGDNEWVEIGDGTNVQENCVFHSDEGFPLTIGAGCTIGHSATVHGCTIGENSLVGMGATILNGARIGKNCIIGAGALITEKKEFPDNSLIVGSPARVSKELGPEAVAALQESAEHYIANWKRFAAGLKQIDV
ncbi:gamma carbonic anhydrase family protein [Aureimonas fodinaquatilis]|uniref:Gamma carbonic anhydrase family protein n=1 Tax=Aureimonas fodinaquatilis TaxID=2565783 RepID=A0A5B0DWB2_9HYPH|nr:gamma carbonic anhydrase family protein [Aureimonas fodinaquatilis]KAA0971044.1 gamma carbonic anhydrase family protein [Aureimonas fodinaquatilis]